MGKPTTKRQTVDDLFDALSESAETISSKSSSKKKDRPHIELTENEQKAFDNFCAADVVHKMAEGRQKAAKSLILPILRKKLLEKWLDQGHKTENPVVQTEKARANFVVRDILKVELSEKEDGSPGSVRDRLMEVGFEEEKADTIFDREFSETVETNFRNLNELRNGEPNEVKAVTKLMKLVMENFSPEERRLLTRKQTKVEVNDGFLDRAVQHCEDIDQLDNLLSVVSPQWVLSHMTYSGRDLKQAVADLTGGELPSTLDSPTKSEDFYSNDRKWKAVANGNTASLFNCDNGNEVLIGNKKCAGGADHARMTCKKWLRDDAYRDADVLTFAKK